MATASKWLIDGRAAFVRVIGFIKDQLIVMHAPFQSHSTELSSAVSKMRTDCVLTSRAFCVKDFQPGVSPAIQ